MTKIMAENDDKTKSSEFLYIKIFYFTKINLKMNMEILTKSIKYYD